MLQSVAFTPVFQETTTVMEENINYIKMVPFALQIINSFEAN